MNFQINKNIKYQDREGVVSGKSGLDLIPLKNGRRLANGLANELTNYQNKFLEKVEQFHQITRR